MTVERLSWASGPDVREGWHHSDIQGWAGMDAFSPPLPEHFTRDHVGPIQSGLPWSDGTMDYVVSHHGLMMLPEQDLVPALVELRRVTKPGGWLRVSVPDIDGAINARANGRKWWFPVEAEDIDTAFCLYVTQGGATRSVFTYRRLNRLLTAAGWESPTITEFGYSPHGPEGITDLDSRQHESIYMEAVKPGG